MRKSLARPGRRPLKIGAAAAFATAAVLATTVAPAFAAATLTLSTSQVAIAGGTVVYITDTGGASLTTGLGVRFALSSGACPTTYQATTPTGSVSAGALTAVDTTVGYITTPALPAGTYKPCLYADALTDSAAFADTIAASGTTTVTSLAFGTLSPMTGAAGTTVTLNSSAAFTGTTYATEFVSGATACPSTYTTPSATAIVGATTKTSTSVLTITVPTTVVAGTSYLVCNYAGTTASSSALAARGNVSFASFGTALPQVTLAPNGGSSATATTVTVSVPTASSVFTGTPDVLITRNSCPYTRPANSALGSITFLEPYQTTVTKISNSKLAVTVPTTVVVGGSDVTTQWNICTYASTSTSAALIAAPAVYTVAPVLSVASAQYAVGSSSAASTGSGPAQGGSQVTFSGLTGIPTAAGALLTASLGGSPITINTVNDSTSFTGTTSAHAAGAVNLTVTTAAGSKVTTGTPYTYTYGITVVPNTAATATTPILDITGAGFGSLTFGSVTDAVGLAASTAYVLLTDNAWNAQTFNGIDAMIASPPPISYCNSVLPISDTEIVCTLNLTARIDSAATNTPTITTVDVPSGTYTVTVVNARSSLTAASYNYSIVSSGSTFTVSPY